MKEKNGWRCLSIHEILDDSYYGVSDSTNSDGKGYPVLRMGNMNDGKLMYENLVHLEMDNNNFEKYKLIKGDILLNRTNSYELVGKVSLFDSEKEYLCASYIVVLRPNSDIINSKYLNYYLNTEKLQKQIKVLATRGVSQANINPTVFKKTIKVLVPPLNEQKKLVEILSTWDLAIEKQEQLIEKKKEFKKGLMQRLLSGEVRFKKFKDEWKIYKVNKLTTQLINKNRQNKISLVLSVTNKRGFITQDEQFEKQVASKDLSNYKIVKKGQFAYNPSRINVGSIDLLRTFDEGLLSPMYVVFKCNEKLISEYFLYWIKTNAFRNQMNKYLSGSVRETLSFDDMGLMKIKLPSIEEQKVIVNVLETVDKEIELLQKELEALKLQKKGLMQRLLTGEVRVKV